ncbi:MAG: hypothetical protein M5R41_19310 [Bacteroidia bacterium]|nr:hypothetical protein [Bacteroidia bacterium]
MALNIVPDEAECGALTVNMANYRQTARFHPHIIQNVEDNLGIEIIIRDKQYKGYKNRGKRYFL